MVVADGVGGANAGEVASRLATETIVERFHRQAMSRTDSESIRLFVEATIQEANIIIWRQGKEASEHTGMGTTIAMGAAGSDWLVLGHVGDSRIYRLRDGELEQLSRDHSFIQEVIDQGFFASREDARRYGIGENILTRALGSAAVVEVATQIIDLATGDLLLFCSDGLNGMIADDWMREILMSVAENSLDAAADALIRIANEQGGKDNITLALIQVGEQIKSHAGGAEGQRLDDD